MNSGFHIDLSKISIDDLQRTLTTGYVLPSRQVLKEDIENRFDFLRSAGINDLEALLVELKTKQKVESFSKRTGLPIDYLTILRREVNGYLSKPISLAKIPSVGKEIIQALSSIGIKNSKVVSIAEAYEVIFSHGSYLAGVHEATDKAQAESLAEMVHKRLGVKIGKH